METKTAQSWIGNGMGKGWFWLGSRAKKDGGGEEEGGTAQLTRVKTPSLAINIYSQIEADENLGTGSGPFRFPKNIRFLSRSALDGRSPPLFLSSHSIFLSEEEGGNTSRSMSILSRSESVNPCFRSSPHPSSLTVVAPFPRFPRKTDGGRRRETVKVERKNRRQRCSGENGGGIGHSYSSRHDEIDFAITQGLVPSGFVLSRTMFGESNASRLTFFFFYPLPQVKSRRIGKGRKGEGTALGVGSAAAATGTANHHHHLKKGELAVVSLSPHLHAFWKSRRETRKVIQNRENYLSLPSPGRANKRLIKLGYTVCPKIVVFVVLLDNILEGEETP